MNSIIEPKPTDSTAELAELGGVANPISIYGGTMSALPRHGCDSLQFVAPLHDKIQSCNLASSYKVSSLPFETT